MKFISNVHIFFVRDTTTFLHWRTPDNSSALFLGALETAESPTKQYKNQACRLHGLQKGHLLIVWELKQEHSELPCSTLARNMCVGQLKFFCDLCISINDYETSVSINFGVTSTF